MAQHGIEKLQAGFAVESSGQGRVVGIPDLGPPLFATWSTSKFQCIDEADAPNCRVAPGRDRGASGRVQSVDSLVSDPLTDAFGRHARGLLEGADKQLTTGLVLVVKFAGDSNDLSGFVRVCPVEIPQPSYF
ncbi:hypothetical protein Xant_18390 [Xanthomonas cissicola]|uniref:Uncharacterized protein n=1 Tax=Xanthomonas cissicola TaxID=86186 RepID=A0ABX3M2L4_9XANT|nr:hypothetical protein Xant_18390 [Xanthomonas cissicola]